MSQRKAPPASRQRQFLNTAVLQRSKKVPTITYSEATHARAVNPNQSSAARLERWRLPSSEEKLRQQAIVPHAFSWNDREQFATKVLSDEYDGPLTVENFELALSQPVDQLACGGCWAIATTACLADRYAIATGSANVLLSATRLLACVQTPSSGCIGGDPQQAMTYLETHGTVTSFCEGYQWCEDSPDCRDGCEPFTAECFERQNALLPECGHADTCPAYKFEADSVHNIGTGPDPLIIESIKYSIFTDGPVVATYLVYMDFILGYPWDETEGVYVHGSYEAGGDQDVSGAHSVVIVGWTHSSAGDYGSLPCWVVRNSWSADWGEDGYFRIAITNSLLNVNHLVYLDVPKTVADDQFGGCVAALPSVDQVNRGVRNFHRRTPTELSTLPPMAWLLLPTWAAYLGVLFTWRPADLVPRFGMVLALLLLVGITASAVFHVATPHSLANSLLKPSRRFIEARRVQVQTNRLHLRLPALMESFAHTPEFHQRVGQVLRETLQADVVPLIKLYGFTVQPDGVFYALADFQGELAVHVVDSESFGSDDIYVYPSDDAKPVSLGRSVPHSEWYERALREGSGWVLPRAVVTEEGTEVRMAYTRLTELNSDRAMVAFIQPSEEFMLVITGEELQRLNDVLPEIVIVFTEHPDRDRDRGLVQRLRAQVQAFGARVYNVDVTSDLAVARQLGLAEFPRAIMYRDGQPSATTIAADSFEHVMAYVRGQSSSERIRRGDTPVISGDGDDEPGTPAAAAAAAAAAASSSGPPPLPRQA